MVFIVYIKILVLLPQITPEFIASLKAGQEKAWSELYDIYGACLYGMVVKNASREMSSQLVLEQLFLRLYEKMYLYEPEKEQLFTFIYKLALGSLLPEIQQASWQSSPALFGFGHFSIE